jgi:NTE family protein
VASLPDSVADTALARLFTGEQASADAVIFSLPGGQHLFDTGDPPDQIYFLRAGRLGAVQRDEGEEPRFLGVIRPGRTMAPPSLRCAIPRSSPCRVGPFSKPWNTTRP